MTTINQPQQEPLADTAAEAVSFGSLTARAAAATRRISVGASPDEVDNAVLAEVEGILRSTAAALTVADGGPKSQVPYNFGMMRVTTELAASRASQPSRRADMARLLVEVADSIVEVTARHEEATARELTSFLSALSEMAVREAGAVGDGQAVL